MAAQNKLELTLALIDKATAPLEAFAKRVDKMQEPIRKVSNRLSLFGEAAGVGKLREGIGRVGESFNRVKESIGELAEKNLIFGAIAGGVLFELTHSAAEYGDAMLKASQKTGVAVEQFEKLAYAGSLADVTQEDLTTSLAKLNKNIVEAVGGSKEMQVWFKRAGISMKDLKSKNTAEIFDKVADSISKLPAEGPRRSALAMGLLGKSGANLIPLLKDGSDGLHKAGDEAERFGLILDKEAAENSEKFNDDLTRLTKVLKGVSLTIGAALMPAINSIVNSFREWILANRELISQRVAEFAAKLEQNLPSIIAGFAKFFDTLREGAETVASIIDAVGGIGNALIILGAIQLLPLVMSIVSVVKALNALNFTILATPVGWFLLAIAAIAGAVYLIYKNWEPIKKFFSDIWSWITDLFTDSIKKLVDLMSMLNPVNLLGGAFNGVKSAFGFGSPALGNAAGAASVAAGTGGQNATQTNNASVTVNFENVPRGTEVTTGDNNSAPVDLSMGYAMATY